MQAERRFYVYILFRPNGVPCYVGKGCRGRWTLHELGHTHHNLHLKRIIKNAGGTVPKIKVREGLTNAEAAETEIAMIAAIGREDCGRGPLVNLTDGGEGVAGKAMKPETLAKLRAANARPEVVAKSRARILRLEQDPEFQQKKREGIARRSQRPEWRERQFVAAQARNDDPAWRKAQLVGAQKRKANPAWIENQRRGTLKAMRARWSDPEWAAAQRLRISYGLRAAKELRL